MSLSIDNYRQMAHDLIYQGKEVQSKDGTMVELLGYQYKIDPYNPWFALTERKLNVPFIAREMLWYIKGDRRDSSIGEYAGVWASVFEADGMAVSNYGHELFHNQRLGHVIGLLERERSTRRAIVHFGHNSGVTSHEQKKDQSCMTAMQFMIRDECLEVVVQNRAQDYIYGVSGDAVLVAIVANIVAGWFEIPMAPITVQVASFHHYPKHAALVERLVDSDAYQIEWKGDLVGKAEAKQLVLGGPLPGQLRTWLRSLVNTEKEIWWPASS